MQERYDDDFGEGRKSFYKVSTKSDVWAVGIILYKLVFRWPHHPVGGLDRSTLTDTEYMTNFEPHIRAINNTLPPDARYGDDFLNTSSDTVPLAMFIEVITACLQYDAERRPTVQGLLNYLDGKCRLPTSYRSRFHGDESSSRVEKIVQQLEADTRDKPLCEH